MGKIIELITSIENWIIGFTIAGSIIGAIPLFSAFLVGEEIIVALSAAALRKAMLTDSFCAEITATRGSPLPIAIVFDILENRILQHFYDKYLQE